MRHNATASIWQKHGSTPWLNPVWQAEQLDVNGSIFRIPNFLSDEEVHHLRGNIVPLLNFSIDTMARTPYHAQALAVGAGLSSPRFSDRYIHAAQYVEQLSPLETADDILFAIEKRIAKLTGVPMHDHELPFTVAHSWPAGASGGDAAAASDAGGDDNDGADDSFGRGAPHLHLPSGHLKHGLYMRPKRIATIFMHLNGGGPECTAGSADATGAAGADADAAATATDAADTAAAAAPAPLSGGDFLFPCVPPLPPFSSTSTSSSSSSASASPDPLADALFGDDAGGEMGGVAGLPEDKDGVHAMCGRLESHFEAGVTHLYHPEHEQRLRKESEEARRAAGQPEPPPNRDADAPTRVAELCAESGPLARDDSMLRVSPKRRDALLVMHVRSHDGEAYLRSWHAGCAVAAGSRWTLEKHKEIPATAEEIEYELKQKEEALAAKKKAEEDEKRAKMTWMEWAIDRRKATRAYVKSSKLIGHIVQ